MDSEKSCGSERGKGCKCPCHKLPGILIAVIGGVVLVANLGVISQEIAGIIWPVLLILIGLMKACKGSCKCCKKAPAV